MTLELNRSLAYSWQTFGEYCADCICSAISVRGRSENRLPVKRVQEAHRREYRIRELKYEDFSDCKSERFVPCDLGKISPFDCSIITFSLNHLPFHENESVDSM